MTATIPLALGRFPRSATDADLFPDDRGTITLDRATLLDKGVFGFERGDPRAAPFSMLRSQLLQRLDHGRTRVVAVTSTQARNGKSFVALNLAAALGRIHPALLIDLDLRRPVIGERLGLPDAGSGVDRFLLGESDLREIRCGVGEHQLGVFSVAEARMDSAEILASDRTVQLFASLRAYPHAPVCIIDAPPILEGDDMMILAPHVDGILLVVEEGRTRQADLRESLRMLRPTPILGTVLNRAILPQRSFGYGQYYPR